MPISSLFLYHQPKKDGTYTIYIYAPLDQGPPAKLSTGKAVAPEKWDPQQQRILGSSNQIKRENLILSGMLSLADMIITDYELRGQPLNRDIFKTEFQNPGSRECFLQYYHREIEGDFVQGLFGMATLVMKRRTGRKMKEFWAGTLPFGAIDKEKIVAFDRWHAQRLKAKGYSGERERAKALKHIKEYMNRARENRKFSYPFHNFKYPRERNSITFLTEQEVRKMILFYESPDLIMQRMIQLARVRGMFEWNIEQYASPSGVARMQKVMKLFLFQCFTGCRYGDTQNFTKRNIRNGFLEWIPEKTAETSGKQVKMKITPMIQKIILGHDRQLLPSLSNVNYNKYLKEVADLLEIDKRLTTHVGRHTFATLFLSRGGSIVALKELMGVTKLKTVMVYFHSAESFLESEMLKVFGSF